MSSVFSKIINKKLPAHIIHENDDFIAFLDSMPVQKGHVLVVPKLEVDNVFDLPLDIYNGLFFFARKVSFAMKEVLDCKRIGISIIGFEVPHAHIHLIPINTIDDMNFKNKKSIKLDEMKLTARKISKSIEFLN